MTTLRHRLVVRLSVTAVLSLAGDIALLYILFAAIYEGVFRTIPCFNKVVVVSQFTHWNGLDRCIRQ